MNREIKFRGKSINSNKWVYAVLHGFGMDCFDECVNKDTIGQFTGLCDKEGKEIYEGDILMCVGQRADNKGRKYSRKVLFKNGSFCMSVPEYNCDSPLHNHVVNVKLNWEVIGNIHDNPELMKGGA